MHCLVIIIYFLLVLKSTAEYNMHDVPRKGSMYCAVAGYEAVENTEVSFQGGDTLELLRVGQEGWWFARHTGTAQEGWVPGSYLTEQGGTSS